MTLFEYCKANPDKVVFVESTPSKWFKKLMYRTEDNRLYATYWELLPICVRDNNWFTVDIGVNTGYRVIPKEEITMRLL